MRLAVIPARGGSKRIPRKNIKSFCGKPMLSWSIEAAIESGCFDRVVVSTDDAEIAEVARRYGAETPFLRPESLSGDFVGTNEVAAHAEDFLAASGENVEFCACIYATAPFLTSEKINEAMSLLETVPEADFSATVTHYSFPIQRSLTVSKAGYLSFREPEHAETRSQDLDIFFHDAGQMYCGRAGSFKKFRTVFQGVSLPVFLEPRLVQDIDTPDDWNRAEAMFKVIRGD